MSDNKPDTRATDTKAKAGTKTATATRVRVVARREGFRRAGIAHPASPTFYPLGQFDEEELIQLQSEPMLVVDLVDDQGQLAPTDPSA